MSRLGHLSRQAEVAALAPGNLKPQREGQGCKDLLGLTWDVRVKSDQLRMSDCLPWGLEGLMDLASVRLAIFYNEVSSSPHRIQTRPSLRPWNL